jgi:hypothetical protein
MRDVRLEEWGQPAYWRSSPSACRPSQASKTPSQTWNSCSTRPKTTAQHINTASGELRLMDDAMSFRPRKFKSFGWRIRGPFEQISFDLRREDVVSVEATDFRSPVMRAFDFSFARIRTSRSGPLGNFLVCAGGRLSMPHIRKNTQQLQRRLMAWMSPLQSEPS